MARGGTSAGWAVVALALKFQNCNHVILNMYLSQFPFSSFLGLHHFSLVAKPSETVKPKILKE